MTDVNASKIVQLVVRRPLTAFFIMAYAFSWITLIPFILSQWNILPNEKTYELFVFLNAFTGPALASYIMHRAIGGKEAWQNVRKRLRPHRAALKWYAFILIGIPVLMFLGYVVLNGGKVPTFHDLSSKFIISYPIYFVAIFYGGGPLAEEIGWRGFAFPRLQTKYGSLKASLLLGVLWACWHLPQFLTSTQGGGPEKGLSIYYPNFLLFLLMCVSITFVMTWVYNHTQGSLFLMILFHASIDTFSMLQSYVSTPKLTDSDLPVVLAFGVFALLVLIFTRGKLGNVQKHGTVSTSSMELGR